jgi:hypothetical protein
MFSARTSTSRIVRFFEALAPKPEDVEAGIVDLL